MVADKRDQTKLISLYQPDVYIGGTFFGKREVFISGFKDIEYAYDSEFIERTKKNFRIAKITEPTYIYHREHLDSLTKKFKV